MIRRTGGDNSNVSLSFRRSFVHSGIILEVNCPVFLLSFIILDLELEYAIYLHMQADKRRSTRWSATAYDHSDDALSSSVLVSRYLVVL